MYNFVTDPSVGPFSRVRRRMKHEYEEKHQNGHKDEEIEHKTKNGKAHVE